MIWVLINYYSLALSHSPEYVSSFETIKYNDLPKIEPIWIYGCYPEQKVSSIIEQYRNNTYPKSCKYTETWETCTKKICDILEIN